MSAALQSEQEEAGATVPPHPSSPRLGSAVTRGASDEEEEAPPPAYLTAALAALECGSPFARAVAAAFVHRHIVAQPSVMARVESWLRGVGASTRTRPAEVSTWQRACPELLPLPSMPVWTGEEGVRAAVAVLEAGADVIRTEVLALNGARAFQAYGAPDFAASSPASSAPQRGTTSGTWSVLYLELHNVDCAQGRAACPRTWEILQSVPRRYGHALVSALAPHTHIAVHCGPVNKKVRLQLPLIVPAAADGSDACRLRVGPRVEPLREGRVLAFDDSYEHEAWNDADASRLVLIVDVWHPVLADEEVKVLDYIRRGQLRKAKALSTSGLIDKGADFYSVLAEGKERGADDADVFCRVPVRDD